MYKKAFLAATSFPVLVFPFTLLGIASLMHPEVSSPFPTVLWFFPLLIGAWNVLFFTFYSRLPGKTVSQKYWFWGMILGIIFPTIGIYNNVPHNLFGFPLGQQYLVYPLGILFYGTLWRYVVRSMNKYFLITKA